MDKKKTNEDFINEVRGIDFSFDAKQKDATQIKLINKLVQSQEEEYMKKSKLNVGAAVAALSMVVVFSSIAYGGQIVDYIKQQITLGNHVTYTQIDEEYLASLEPMTVTGTDNENFYITDGSEASSRDYIVQFSTIEEASAYFITDLLTPSYVPDGFTLSHAELYKDEVTGKAQENTKYINWTYSNGNDEITIMVRYLDNETAFESGLSDDYQLIQINGYDTLVDGRTVDIAVDGVLYSFFCDDTAESVKMAESLFQ